MILLIQILRPAIFSTKSSTKKTGLYYEYEQSYYLINDYDPLKLSKRQLECLFLGIRGKTCKQIAQCLNNSFRSVETHFEILKQKFNCYSRAELIEKAINLGYQNRIPSTLIKRT